MNIKRTMNVLIVALFVVSSILMGCAAPTEAPTEKPQEEPAAGKVTLTLIHPWAGEEWDQFAPVVDAAEKALGIEIEPKVLRSDDLITQLSTQWAAGTAPGDVIFLTVPSLIKKGAQDGHVMEVTDLVNPNDFSPGAVDFNTVDGKIYGVPYCEGVKPGFWYRKSFFEAHGLSEPTTKEEFVALLEQIQGIEGIKAPIGSGDGDGWPLSDVMEHFLVAYEGPELLAELSTCTCPGSWDKVEGVFVNDFAPLVEAGHFSEPIEWTTAMEMWWNGDFALYFMGNWLTAMVDDPDDLGLIPIPGTQGVAGAIDFLFVSTYTEHPEEAKALLAWLATTGQEVRASQGGTVATYLAVSPDAYPPAERMMADAIAEMTPLFDLDDSIGGKFQTTFWDQLKLLWVSPDRAAEVVEVIHESYNEACGCDTSEVVTPEEAKVTLTLIHPWAGEEWDQFAPVVDAAEKALGIEIEPKVLRSDDLITQLSTQWAAGTAPGDVIFLTVPSLIKKGAQDGHVMEVTDLVNPNDFSPGAVDFNTVDGKIYGVPYCEGVKPGFWYRKSFFEAHGLSEPTTKEEFVALLEQIQGIEGIKAPIGSGDGDGWPLSDVMEHFLVAYEGPELLAELSTCTCPGSWDKVEGVFVNDFAPLVEAGHFSEPIEWTTAMEMWWNGDFALYFMGNWLTAMVDDPDDLGLIPIPGTQGVAGAIDFLFVSTYTEHPEEAKALLAWLATTGQEVRASQGGTVATYLAVSPDAYPPAEKMMADAIAEMTPLFDLDDSIGGKFQTTFWDQLKLLWVSPDRAAEVVEVIHESYNDACGCE